MFNEEHVIYRYKYLPFSEGAQKTISEGTMKFTCPLEFNDPFDCMPFYDTKNIDQITKLRPDLYKATGKKRGLSPAKRIVQKPKDIARLRSRVHDGTFARDLMTNIGVVCLTRDPLNILMWSHYAKDHKGFLLEFRIPVMGTSEDSLLATERLVPHAIRYQQARPSIELGSTNPPDLVERMALTKSKDWSYEQEERVIDQKRGSGIHKYQRDDILCSVIAGMSMDKKDYIVLDSLVSSIAKSTIPNLRLYQATPVRDEYRLEVKGHPRITANRVV
jgi:hypothetical protein